jgi:hydroxyethylthiazole kinase
MLSPDRPVTSKDIPAVAAEVLERIRARAPRIHCITNVVAQNFSANMLLAAGAIPSMTIAPDEIVEFVARADALLVNLGTFDAERRVATNLAIDAMAQQGKPWLLDPVFVERSQQRTLFALSLLPFRPRAVRLNQAEFKALSGSDLDGASLARFGEANDTVVGLTGETDIVFGGGRLTCISNGHPLMSKVTAMGCAGSALVGACLAVENDPWVAVASGLLILGVAGQIAGESAAGPGSLAFGILDALHALDAGTLIDRARVV